MLPRKRHSKSRVEISADVPFHSAYQLGNSDFSKQSVNKAVYHEQTYQPHSGSNLQRNRAIFDNSPHFSHLPFVCSLCGKGYASLTGLTLHNQVHKGKSFLCPVCDAKFTQRGTMKRHLKSIHVCQQCPKCEGIFPCGHEFEQHILSHV